MHAGGMPGAVHADDMPVVVAFRAAPYCSLLPTSTASTRCPSPTQGRKVMGAKFPEHLQPGALPALPSWATACACAPMQHECEG